MADVSEGCVEDLPLSLCDVQVQVQVLFFVIVKVVWIWVREIWSLRTGNGDFNIVKVHDFGKLGEPSGSGSSQSDVSSEVICSG